MDPITFLWRLLGVSSRIGAAVAILAAVTFVGRSNQWSFFVEIDAVAYQSIMIGGLCGVSLIGVDVALHLARLAIRALKHLAVYLRVRKATIRNMQVLSAPDALVLRYLRNNNFRRFRASSTQRELLNMKSSGLIVIDDPAWSIYSDFTYYKVPGYVWRRISQLIPNENIPHLRFINPPINK